MMIRRILLLPCLVILLTACQSASLAALAPSSTVRSPADTAQPSFTSSLTSTPSLTSTLTDTPIPSETLTPEPTLEPSATFTPTQTPLPSVLGLDPADWKNWPVNPVVPERARQIYLIGQALGNDPHAFSIFGDCQSEPNVFMSLYETDPGAVAALSPELQQTVAWFSGSFNRMSPTVRPGTTTGALLWTLWHQNKFTCGSTETPLQCELRIHKPSFVIIQVGTHYETRNQDYMRMILDQLIAAGVVPILATKADDRELNDHVNAQYAQLAAEYNIPFWNFWAAVKDLPNRGLYTRPDATYQGDLYLTPDAVIIHRLTALQALDTVWRAVTGGQ
jgi:hypothetical protein